MPKFELVIFLVYFQTAYLLQENIKKVKGTDSGVPQSKRKQTLIIEAEHHDPALCETLIIERDSDHVPSLCKNLDAEQNRTDQSTMILPFAKLGALALRSLSKPLASRVKSQAARHERFRKIIERFAQVFISSSVSSCTCTCSAMDLIYI